MKLVITEVEECGECPHKRKTNDMGATVYFCNLTGHVIYDLTIISEDCTLPDNKED